MVAASYPRCDGNAMMITLLLRHSTGGINAMVELSVVARAKLDSQNFSIIIMFSVGTWHAYFKYTLFVCGAHLPNLVFADFSAMCQR